MMAGIMYVCKVDFNTGGFVEDCVKVHSHLRFIKHELLREFFSPGNSEKWVNSPLLNFSVQEILHAITDVTVST